MICKYEDYLKEPYVLTIEQMQQIHNDLLANLDNDPEALKLYEELIAAATKYAAMRAKWLQLPRLRPDTIQRKFQQPLKM